MKMSLSVIITVHNDAAELAETVNSIRATAFAPVEIVVIDDASAKALPEFEGVTMRRTERRIGVGPARRLGVLMAKSQFVLIVDSHCRFTAGWLQAAMERIAFRPTTVHCGVCLGLGQRNDGAVNMDVNNPNAAYYGATWNFLGPDRKFPKEIQVFESIWQPEQEGDDYELPAVMGACYLVPREWYLKLHCGMFLNSYGCDEQELSLKTWLAGGEIRMHKGVRIGHKFKPGIPSKRAKYGGQLSSIASPYNATIHVVRNKLFLILTIVPQPYRDVLLRQLKQHREFSVAMKFILSEWRLVETERAYNQTIFTRDFSWLLNRFGLSMPLK